MTKKLATSAGSSGAASKPPGNASIRQGRWFIILATVFWSTSGFFAKAPLLDRWPADERGVLLGFWRATFAGIALLPFAGRPVWRWGLVPAAVAFAVMNASFLLAVSNTTAANAIWLQYTAPVWVFLFGTWILKEKVIARDRWMLLSSMTGVAVILFFECGQFVGSTANRWGVIFGLLAGVAFAGVILSLRQLRELNGYYVLAICNLASALLLAPAVYGKGSRIDSATGAWMATFGILQMALPYVLFTRGLRSVTGHEASCITLLEPLLVPIWVFLFWRHSPEYQFPRWWTWLGATLILIGLVIRYWPKSSRIEPD